MRVSDMAQNPKKAQAENLYLAEKKYSLYKTGLSFKQIRNSLNLQYGGFDNTGKYFKAVHKSIDYSP